MDYSDGSCMAMFTKQQKAIMEYYLARSPRSGNVSAARWPYDPEKEAAGFTRRREESQDVDISSEP
jgi:hypothetical protein